MKNLLHDFNPLSPHGERQETRCQQDQEREISIHSPHTGRDYYYNYYNSRLLDFNPLSPHGERLDKVQQPVNLEIFQSTLPTRGETAHAREEDWLTIISIHSPHTGRDRYQSRCIKFGDYFNPLSPHGERQGVTAFPDAVGRFQSTLPTRGET